MATFANDNNLLEYEPDIRNYGIHDFSDIHEKTYDDIIRDLQIHWWPTAQYGRYDISVTGGQLQRLTQSKLDSTQFTRLACYVAFAEYIYPRLSTFSVEGDVFREKMMYYKDKAASEFQKILQEGVRYDLDSSGDYSDSEKQSFFHNRLIR